MTRTLGIQITTREFEQGFDFPWGHHSVSQRNNFVSHLSTIEPVADMPKFTPRTRAKKGEDLTEPLQGELALYEQVGLFTKPIVKRTAYRYRGVLLQYQKALKGNPPSVQASIQFLAKLRQDGFKPATLRLYRAALRGFHSWRGEELYFPVKVPKHLPPYHSAELVDHILSLARSHPRDHVTIRLMSDAGLRREEVVSLQIRNVDLTNRFIRIRGKGDKDRVIPLTQELYQALAEFCKDRSPDEFVIGIKGKAVWNIVKKYAAMADKPDLHPHDLRHAFATRLAEGKANIRAIQDLMGHEDLATTAVYLGIAPKHLQEAISILEQAMPTDIEQPPSGWKEQHKALTELEKTKKHHEAMSSVVQSLREGLNPDFYHNPIRDLGGPGIHFGKANSSVIWRNTDEGSTYLCLSTDLPADVETEWVISFLHQHLMSSQYSWLATDQYNGMEGWKRAAGLELAKRCDALKALDELVSKTTGLPPTEDQIIVGPTIYFSDTIWAAAIDSIHSARYQIVREPPVELFQVRYGPFLIALTSTKEDADQFQKWHSKLMRECSELQLIQESIELKKQRESIGKAIDKALAKMSVSGYIPGVCEDCT
ncbi:tyrosine-type recombinase/integrase [Chloroflexota bacterium]